MICLLISFAQSLKKTLGNSGGWLMPFPCSGEGAHVRFQSITGPRQIMNSIEYLKRCWKERAHVRRFFDERAFLDRCLGEKGRLEFYLNTRENLKNFNLDEGTVLFPEEHRLLKELVETANTLPGPIVEIGTLFGFTTTRFAVWKKPEKKIITVDN
jgi:hypothetical protein